MRTGPVLTGVAAAAALAAGGFSLFSLLAPGVPEERAARVAPAHRTETAATTPAPTTPAPTTPAASGGVEVAGAPEEAEAAGDAARPVRPGVDVVRVERDGEALVAGRAAPGAEVTVRLDGRAAARATAGRDGGFVAFLRIPPGEGGETRRLDVVDEGDAEGARVSEAVIVAAPSGDAPDAQPLVVAAREGGVEVLQRPDVESPEGVTIETASRAPGGALTISGRAEGLARLRVFADAQLVAETVADADGRWTAEAEAAPDSAGAFRVEQVSEGGDVLARAAAPFLSVSDDDRAPRPGEVLVRPGDSLWRIAENLLGEGVRFTVIYEANAEIIRDPDLIFPGQLITVPGAVARP